MTIKVYNILDSKKGPNTFIIDKNTKIKLYIEGFNIIPKDLLNPLQITQ